jgi:5-formyltetrahydrofolate cyclo-ligase
VVPLIALLYDDELVGHVPAAAHDVPIRAVVRPAHGVTSLPASA